MSWRTSAIPTMVSRTMPDLPRGSAGRAPRPDRILSDVSLHAILVLPALAFVLAHFGWWVRRRVHAVAIAIGLYALATLAVLVISLRH